MKTTVLIVSIIISTLFSNILMAQGKNELNFSYGYSGFELFLWSWRSECPDQTYGTISLNYNRRINEKMSVGGGINYTPIKSNRCGGPSIIRSDIEHFLLPYAKFEYRYIIEPEFELYSSANIAYQWFFSHLTLIGCNWGDKHAFFGELGIGGGQLISAGYSIKF